MVDSCNTLPPLSLYVHFPWCIKKCPYCDFNSHVAPAFSEQTYVDVLLRDLQLETAFAQNRKLHSIFFGGGTPSLMSGKSVEAILQAAEKHIGFEADIEITLEANPGASEQARFKDYHQAGVNRLSIGAQSFGDRFLTKLGRIHSAAEIERAIGMAKQAGFDNFNIDLMYALPEQTLDEALSDLQKAIAFLPPHISWYQLTLEPNTVFYREPPALPHEDLQFDMMQAGHQLLRSYGYHHYETSAWSKLGTECKHNRNYWEFGDYLGVGAGAHGKITQHAGNDKSAISVRRRQKTRMPEHYLQSINPCSDDRFISHEELPGEFAMNALRLLDGVPRDLFVQRTGLPFAVIEPTVRQLMQEGLLLADDKQFKVSAQGALFLNTAVARFLNA